MGLRREQRKKRRRDSAMRDFSFGGIYKTVLEVLVFVLIETADPYIFEVLYYLRRLPTLHSWLKSEKSVI